MTGKVSLVFSADWTFRVSLSVNAPATTAKIVKRRIDLDLKFPEIQNYKIKYNLGYMNTHAFDSVPCIDGYSL